MSEEDVCRECRKYGDDYEMHSDGTIVHCCEECVYGSESNADGGRTGTDDNGANGSGKGERK